MVGGNVDSMHMPKRLKSPECYLALKVERTDLGLLGKTSLLYFCIFYMERMSTVSYCCEWTTASEKTSNSIFLFLCISYVREQTVFFLSYGYCASNCCTPARKACFPYSLVILLSAPQLLGGTKYHWSARRYCLRALFHLIIHTMAYRMRDVPRWQFGRFKRGGYFAFEISCAQWSWCVQSHLDPTEKVSV